MIKWCPLFCGGIVWRGLKNHTLKKVIPTRTNKSFFFFLVKQKKKMFARPRRKNACRKIGRVGSVFFVCFFTLKTIGLRFAYQEHLFDLSFEGCTAHLLQLLERLGYPVSDIEIGLAYHLLCRSRSRCWNIVSKVGLCRRDKYMSIDVVVVLKCIATTKQNSFCRHETIEMWRK